MLDIAQFVDKVHLSEALKFLKSLPDNCVNSIVTSPPYFGQRDYGSDLQIGLESHPQYYIDALTTIFREANRVLKKDGTLWLNLGDNYVGATS